MRPRLKVGVIPTQNLPLRLFDKDKCDGAKEARTKRRLPRAAVQTQQSNSVQSLWNSDVEQLLTASLAAPAVNHGEAATSRDGSNMEIDATLGRYNWE